MASAPDVDSTTYPPADHLLRDLGIVSHRVSPTRTVSATLLGDDKIDRAGRPAIGFMATFVDINAAQVALLASQPRWTATVGLALHASGATATGSLLSESQLVRAGSNLVIVRTTVFDGQGRSVDELLDEADSRPADGDVDELSGTGPGRRRIATALLSFGRIPAKASVVAASFDPDSSEARSRLEPMVAPRPGDLLERMDAGVVAPGVVSLDPSAYVTNSFGTVTGGVYGVLFQAAAESRSAGLVAVDVEIQFLSQSTSGPVVVTADLVRETAAGATCALEARVGDKVLAMGSVTLEVDRHDRADDRAGD